MPARTERITLIPSDNKQPNKTIRFPIWWDRRGFFDKFRERELDTGNPFYVDYAYLLTAGEAMVWNKECHDAYIQQQANPPQRIVETMTQIEATLKKCRWVIVESVEWESGMS